VSARHIVAMGGANCWFEGGVEEPMQTRLLGSS
jgi:hypothetical protein